MSNTATETPVFEFKTVDRPKVTRSGKPNPFAAPVAEFIAAGEAAADKAVTFETPMGKGAEKEIKVKGKVTGKRVMFNDVERVLRQLRSAAPDTHTVRTVVTMDTPRKGVAQVQFWVKPIPPAAAPVVAE